MNDTEQPPSREPLQAEEEDDEDTLEHWRDVALRNPDPDERENAISELDLDDPAAMDVLIQTLDDRDPAVRLAALSALWLAADEPPTGILAPLINDPDPEVRIEVVGMLADSEEPRARQLLRSALDDADEDVRDAAASALDLD